jgi:hypothetical protein
VQENGSDPAKARRDRDSGDEMQTATAKPETAAEKKGRELRQGGRLVDVRLRLTAPPDSAVLRAVESRLREDDAVFSFEGYEIELALSGTNPDATAQYVLPRLRDALRDLGQDCHFAVNGEPADPPD